MTVTAAPAPVLEIKDLSVALGPRGGRVLAVEDLTLSVAAGETVCLVGESGSGKSMTALSVLGLLPRGVTIAGGAIRLDGQDLLALSPREMRGVRGRQAAMVFQEPMTALNPVWTVGEQVNEVYQAHMRMSAAERRDQTVAMLASVGLPDPACLAGRHPHELSGGQRQRAMIAMALALRPRLLIADEPTTALDVTTQAQILSLLAERKAETDMGVLFITHDFGVVADIADRVAVMHRGRLVETGTRDEVLMRPKHAYTRSLIAAAPSLTPPPARARSVEPLLRAQGLSKTYQSGGVFARPGRKAVDDVSLVLHRGETLGVVGESGSGKSTLARIALGLIAPDAGKIWLGDQDLTAATPSARRAVRKRLQVVFQDPYSSLNRRRSVADIVAQGPINFGVAPAEALAAARALLTRVGLDANAGDRFPHQFSGGQRQRIGIARALALQPDILVADEPVSALDVSVQAQVLDLLADLRDEFGLSLLFITHDLRVAAQTCDRIIVMRNGRIVEEAVTGQLFAHPREAYTRALLDSAPGRLSLGASTAHKEAAV